MSDVYPGPDDQESGIPQDTGQAPAQAGAAPPTPPIGNPVDWVANPESAIPESAPGEGDISAQNQGPPTTLSDMGGAIKQGAQSLFPKMARYLQGADAAPRQVVAALENQIDPNNTMDQNERSMRTIEAASHDSSDVGWGVMQYYRAQFNAMKGGAAVALAKGSNPEVVAQNLTNAYSFLPDGNKVTFAPAKSGGYVAQVHTMDGDTQSYQLSPEQLNQFVRSNDGAYDNLMHNKVGDIMQQLAKSQGRTIEQLQGANATNRGAPPAARPYGGTQPQLPPGQNGLPAGYTEGPGMKAGPTKATQAAQGANPFKEFSPEQIEQARIVTKGNDAAMLQYLLGEKEKQQTRESAETVSQVRGADAAAARAAAPARQGADTAEARNLRNQATNNRLAQQEYDKTYNTLENGLMKQVNPKTGSNYTPDEAADVAEAQMTRRGLKRPADLGAAAPPTDTAGAGAPLQAAPQAIAPQPAPTAIGRQPVRANQLPPKEQLVKGQTYNTPKGSLTWTGTGFLPQGQ
jgi:hypothetical protein